ncbi:MAG: hypothetical protein ACE5G6_05505 [Terriglobia bacterium]
MSACRDWHDRLLDYTLGAVSVSVDPVVEHVQHCAGCAATLAEFRARRAQLDAALGQLLEGAEPSPAFRARVLAAAETSAMSWLGRPAWVGVLAAAGVLVLAAVLLPELGERRASPTRSRPPSVVALSEWRSPTESLLRSPGGELLWSTPSLGEFYFPLPSARPGAGEEKGGNNES